MTKKLALAAAILTGLYASAGLAATMGTASTVEDAPTSKFKSAFEAQPSAFDSTTGGIKAAPVATTAPSASTSTKTRRPQSPTRSVSANVEAEIDATSGPKPQVTEPVKDTPRALIQQAPARDAEWSDSFVK